MKTNKPKEIRGAKGISQDEARKVIGVSINAYRDKERGATRFYFDEIEALADFYGVSILEFTDKQKASTGQNKEE